MKRNDNCGEYNHNLTGIHSDYGNIPLVKGIEKLEAEVQLISNPFFWVKSMVKRTVEEWERLSKQGLRIFDLTKEEVEYCGGDCDNCNTDWCPHNTTE